MSGGLDWYEYERGLILEVDPASGSVERRVAYESPPGSRVDEDPVVLFKSATLVGDTLYACTQTELLLYRVLISPPPATSACPASTTSTTSGRRPTTACSWQSPASTRSSSSSGTGRSGAEWGVIEGEGPWDRFDPAVDYRLVRTTKPHHAHPNHVFQIGDEVWATRFEQRDAVSLTQPGRRIAIDLERPHDGLGPRRPGLVHHRQRQGRSWPTLPPWRWST